MADVFELDMQDVDALRSAVYKARSVLDYVAAGYSEAPEAVSSLGTALGNLNTALEAFAEIVVGDGGAGGDGAG